MKTKLKNYEPISLKSKENPIFFLFLPSRLYPVLSTCYTGMQLLRPRVVARAVRREMSTLMSIPHCFFEIFMTIN